MTSRIQAQRFPLTATQPPNLSRPPGELWLNFPDMRLGMIDTTRASVDLLAVRPHAATATYAAGDHVVYAGQLQRAKTSLAPKAYLATDWDPLQPQSFNDSRYTTQTLSDLRYLKLAGGTLTGPLALAADPITSLGAATKQYVDTGTNAALTVANAAVPKAGATMTGLLILSGDPSAVLGAATKQYVDGTIARAGGPFLPLSGGTVSGPVTVNANLQATGLYATTALYPNAFNGYEWVFGVDANGSKFETYRAGGWYDVWNGTNGTRSWVGPAGVLMSLTGSGVFSTKSDIICGGGITSIGGSGFALAFFSGRPTLNFAASQFIQWDGGSSLIYSATGSHVFYGPVTTNGDVTVNGRVIATGDVRAGAGSYAQNDTTFGFNAGGSGRIFSWAPGCYYDFYPDAGLVYTRFGAIIWAKRSDGIAGNYVSYVAGNGAYSNWSDARIKAEIEDARYGLADIERLRPRRFHRLAHPADPPGVPAHAPEIGFIADEVREVIPEAVSELAVPPGQLPHVGDTALALQDGMILAAAVNALKELAIRVRALEEP